MNPVTLLTQRTSRKPALPRTIGRTRADLAELAWVWSIVGYSLLRFVVAWGAFSETGANVWVFGLIDVGTAWPYAKSVATVCRRAAASEWSLLPVPLALAIGTFFAPYAYLWFAAGEMPPGVRLGMILCVSVLLCAASVGVLSKTRKLRRAEQHEATARSASTTVDLRCCDGPTELLIDLTKDQVSVTRTPV